MRKHAPCMYPKTKGGGGGVRIFSRRNKVRILMSCFCVLMMFFNLMSTNNIGFYEDLTKNIFELSSNTHFISSADFMSNQQL